MSARWTISVLARGNVEAGFDDRGRQQDVVLAVVEGADLVLELARRHLAVRDDEFALGRVLAQERRRFVEVLDARADIERLAAAIALAQQRLAHDQRVERRDEGAHREPVDRRRRDDRQLAHAGHRQLQRARDRRRRQRQHMHFGAQLLQPLLVADAEMLLLVDDDEAEVLEAHGLAEHRVGADDDVDRALGEALLRLALLGRADHARELADADRQAGEALAEVLRVLAREQRRRRDDRRLLAVDRGGEGGAQRDLGLAEADVAADQPIHRPAGGEIVERRLDRARLVLRLVIGKARAEFVVEAFGRDERAARRGSCAARRRGSARPPSRARASSAAPCASASPPRRACRARPSPSRSATGARDFRPAGTAGRRRRSGFPGNRAARPPPRSSSGRRSGRRRGRCGRRDRPPTARRLGQHVLRAPLALRLAHQPVAENVLLADDREVRRLEAVFERDDRERQRAGARRLRLRVGGDEFQRFQAMLGEHMAEPFARAVAPAGDDRRSGRARASARICATAASNTLAFSFWPLGREIAPDPPAAVDDVGRAGRGLEGRQPRQRRGREPLLPLVFAQVEPVGRSGL